MEAICTEIAMCCGKFAKDEAQYLCCFNSYAAKFDEKKEELKAKLLDVDEKIEEARGVSRVTNEAQEWTKTARSLVDFDTRKDKCFNDLCPNCWRQYWKGKDLAQKTQRINELLETIRNCDVVAGPADFAGIKYHSINNFMRFESRESTFQNLKKALEDENFNMIGLHGFGGTGKTSMAIEVGAKLEGSKKFDKVIFLVVSQSPNFKKILHDLGKHLDLTLDEGQEVDSKIIWSRITEMKGKLLIILDDVWQELDLTRDLGIPSSQERKACSVLVTTRNLHVCESMGCQVKIQIEILIHKDALNLFLAHTNINDSSRGLRGVPEKLVKHCGGLPVVIIAIASSLKNEPISVWKDYLKTLEDGSVDQNLEEAYKCLKLSYDNLKNQKAKELLLICSLLPEDYNMPIQLFTKIGTGLGSFGENDKYHLARSEVHRAIMELIDYSLLLNGEKGCIKMHDLVREVVLWIEDKDIQSLMDFKNPIKENLRYMFLMNNGDFLDEFDGNKLEFLLIHCLTNLNVSSTFFKEKMRLKVLVLIGTGFYGGQRIPALSLMNSLQPLKDIRTLTLSDLNVGNISILGNLSTLVALQLCNCFILELSIEFLKLKKLKSLELEECKIEKNNPFEVIERCYQLEEFTFVGNDCDSEQKGAISQNGPPLRLHRYCIASKYISYYVERYPSISRCFQIDELIHLVSNATFKQLVREAEILFSEGWHAEVIWKNLIPDIVPIDEGGAMNDLIILHLQVSPDMECLIDNKDHHSSVTAFRNLAELHLCGMGVEDLCRGPQPSHFLEQLEIMKLKKCHKLKSILSYNLRHLKSMELEDCPKLTSVFLPSTALCLMQLEELKITSCSALEYIVMGENGDSNQKSYYDSMFPRLKIFRIAKCNKIRIIFSILFTGGLPSLEKISICESEQLEYIFDKFQEGEDVMLPSLIELELFRVPTFIGISREYYQLMNSSVQKPSAPLSRHNSNNINQSAATRAFSWVQTCCPLNKLRSSSKKTNIVVSEYRSLGHTKSPGLDASKKWIDTAPVLVRQLVLHVGHIRKMELAYLSLNSVSTLFTLSMASMISWEELTIKSYDGLKHLVTIEEDDYKDQINCSSIFPKLHKLEILECEGLECLFMSTISIEIKYLKSLTIKYAPKLTYVIGKYQHDELLFDLPALEALCLEYVPEFISIGPMNYKMVSPSLQNVSSDEGQLNLNTTKELDASKDRVPPFHAAQSLLMQSLKKVREIELWNCAGLISLSTLSIAASTISLELLTIRNCHELKCISTQEGDVEVDKNNCSMFPRLEKLEIDDCQKLEFLFVSAISGGLEKLKSLTIKRVPELKYVVGTHLQEQHSSNQNQNQNDELYFKLPALETLTIAYASKIKGICTKNYKMMSSPLLKVEIWNFGFKSPADYGRLKWRNWKAFPVSTDGAPLSHVAQSLLIPSLKNIRKIELLMCANILALSTLSTASAILWEDLTIKECGHLKCIVAYEGDAGTHTNYNSIFPKLKLLQVSDCYALEYLFPTCAYRCPPKLESLRIYNAPMLKYVFGRSQHDEDSLTYENQIIETHFDFPALKDLTIRDVPKLVSIYPENYYLSGLSLRSIIRVELTMKPVDGYPHFVIEQKQSQIYQPKQVASHFARGGMDSKIEVLFYLTNMDREKSGDVFEPLKSSLQELELRYLSELMTLCWGPKRFIRFHNLQKLIIMECKKLRVIFSASTVRSLPMLKLLHISRCEELVHIVEEDYETNKPCFPNLEKVSVDHCYKLKYLFSITISDILPKLRDLYIRYSFELEHVLIRRDEMKEMVMKDVLPRLSKLSLFQLPNLFSVCHGVDFQILKEDNSTHVAYCPVFSFYETSTIQLQEDHETPYFEVEGKAEEKISSHLSTYQYINMEEASAQQSISGSISLMKVPIHTNPNLTLLPTRGNTHTSANFFEEEEEEQGGLITSRRPRSGTKAGNPFMPPVTTILSGQTSETVLPLNPMSSKASASLNQTPLFDSQPRRAMPTTPFVTISQDESSEDELFCKDVEKETNRIDPHSLDGETRLDIQSNETKNIVEVRGEDGTSIVETPHPSSLTSQMEPITMSLNSTFLPRNPSTTVKFFEDKGGMITTHRHQRDMKAASSLLVGRKHNTYNHGRNVQENVGTTNQPLYEASSTVQIPMFTPSESTYGRKIQENVGTTNQPLYEASSPVQIPLSTPSESTYGRNIQENVGTTNQSSYEAFSTVQIPTITPSESTYGSNIQENVGTTNQPLYEASSSVQIPTFTPSESTYVRNVQENVGTTSQPLYEGSSTRQIPMSTPTESTYGRNVQENVGTTSQLLYEGSSTRQIPMSTPTESTYGRNVQENVGTTSQPLYEGSSTRQIPMSTRTESTYGRNVHENVVTTNQPLYEAFDAFQVSRQFVQCGSSEMDPAFYEINNDTSVVGGQEIVDMMKLEGVEASMLIEAFKNNPQLCLSSEHRSIELLCFSYRVLLNILNILATRSPFTITDADQRLLAKYLDDAFVLGFDKDWLKSIRIKVINYDVSKVQRMQQVLNDLGNKLQTKKTELAIVHDQVAKASQSAEMTQKVLEEARYHFNIAQQEHANARVHHSQLLEKCQEILEQRDQCWETIATEFSTFGF